MSLARASAALAPARRCAALHQCPSQRHPPGRRLSALPGVSADIGPSATLA